VRKPGTAAAAESSALGGIGRTDGGSAARSGLTPADTTLDDAELVDEPPAPPPCLLSVRSSMKLYSLEDGGVVLERNRPQMDPNAATRPRGANAPFVRPSRSKVPRDSIATRVTRGGVQRPKGVNR